MGGEINGVSADGVGHKYIYCEWAVREVKSNGAYARKGLFFNGNVRREHGNW